MPSQPAGLPTWLRSKKQPSVSYTPVYQDEEGSLDHSPYGSSDEKIAPSPRRKRSYLVCFVIFLLLAAAVFFLPGRSSIAPSDALPTDVTQSTTDAENIPSASPPPSDASVPSFPDDVLAPSPIEASTPGDPAPLATTIPDEQLEHEVAQEPETSEQEHESQEPGLEQGPEAHGPGLEQEERPKLQEPEEKAHEAQTPETQESENEVTETQEPGSESKAIVSPPRKMHFLLPATSSNSHLCRTIFTAVVMGYPEPVLINWGVQAEPGQGGVVSHLKKVTGVKDYLAKLGPEAADDLVLITDAFDLWFHLPATVLVQRYEKIVKSENKRIAHLYGEGALENGIHASTVFAADKGCVGHGLQDHWCWLQAESTVAPDAYGNKTDVEFAGFVRLSTIRPRYLNSGVIIGPVSDVLSTMQRTEDYMKSMHITQKSFWQSDQRVIIKVYASQELSRIRLAAANPQWRNNSTSTPAFNRTSPYAKPLVSGNLDAHPDVHRIQYMNLTLQPGERATYEHGITVDSSSALSHTTSAADYEWAYLRYTPDGPQGIPDRSDPRNCKTVVRDALPDDLANIPVPYAEVRGNETTSWSDLILYTQLCTGEIPAIIHNNGSKRQRELQWPTLWYAWYGHEILAAARARLAADPGLNIGVGGASTDGGQWMTWDQVCKPYTEDIFHRDLERYKPGTTSYGVPVF